MADPDFSTDTVLLLASRSAHICNNPDCLTITVGPSDGTGALALKIGEAAHIYAARQGKNYPQARWNASMTDQQRAHFSNGIWLCASCHTLVDKNQGADFPANVLQKWKSDHEALIKALLHSHRSPIPLLRQVTDEGRIAQALVDELEQHGALFVDMIYEDGNHVTQSVLTLKKKLRGFSRQVKLDQKLKKSIQDLAGQVRDFLNHTSAFPMNVLPELPHLRLRVAGFLRIMEKDFGCRISGRLRSIM